MLKEALEYVVNLKAPHLHKDGERVFSDKALSAVTAPTIKPLEVSSLGGFCDLVDASFESFPPLAVVILVESPERVYLVAKQSDNWARRITYLIAKLPEVRGFNFGNFIDHESFIVGLQTHFAATADRDYLLRLASSLSAERVRTSEDDGISQTVALRAGVVLKSGETAVRSRVELAPFRTFREVEQPASEFVFRLRNAKESEPPSLALFEADGGAWRLIAMETIGHWLRERLGAADKDGSQIPVVI